MDLQVQQRHKICLTFRTPPGWELENIIQKLCVWFIKYFKISFLSYI